MKSRPMFQTLESLVLASASPRRIKMLSRLGIVFESIPSHVDETPLKGEMPEKFVRRMAAAKVNDVIARSPGKWIIGADTVVTLDGRTILGKPVNAEDAFAILHRLADKTHQVMTGLCLCAPGGVPKAVRVESTRVTFDRVSDALLRAYVATGEPLDKAGAYGIQGAGSVLVREISGSCSNVIGMPLNTITSLLMEFSIITPRYDRTK